MIDWARSAEIYEEIGAEDFPEVIELFLDEVQESLDALDQARDDSALKEALHFMKGCALNIGFKDFAAKCQQGETAASQGQGGSFDRAAVATCFAASRADFLAEWRARLAGG